MALSGSDVRAFPTPRERTKTVFRLIQAAEGHAPTVGGILGIGAHAVSDILARKYMRERWRAWKRKRGADARRAARLRWFWRDRLRAVGIDHAALPVTDPLWRACHIRPRGALVRDVSRLMRAEDPGASLATNHNIDELLRRVAALSALDEAAQREALGIVGVPPVD